jgi:hypothetical protein
VLADAAEDIDVSTGGTLELLDVGTGIELLVPEDFATTSAQFQAKKIADGTVITATGVPPGHVVVGTYTYALRALTDELTLVETFLAPLTLTMYYTSSDIAGLEQGSLALYHWNGTAWSKLEDCVIDAAASSVACSTTHFSTFGLFGQEAAVVASSRTQGTSIRSQVQNLIRMGNIQRAEEIKREWPKLFPEVVAPGDNKSVDPVLPTTPVPQTGTTTPLVWDRDLMFGMIGDDVRRLQEALIAAASSYAATTLALHGTTTYFGLLTQAALIEYQRKEGITPAVGYFGPITRARLGR